MTLSAKDIAGAIAELTQAVGELAIKTGHGPDRQRPELSVEQSSEVLRLTAGNPMFRQDAPAVLESDFRPARAGQEVDRIAMSYPREFGASRDTTLALSRAQPSVVPGQLVSKWGLGITLGGRPVMDTPSNRVSFGQVVPVMVRDVTEDPSEDISHLVGNPTGGLGDDDTGLDDADARVPNQRPTAAEVQAELDRLTSQYAGKVSGFGEPPGLGVPPANWGQERDAPGVSTWDAGLAYRTGSPAVEVARLQEQHGFAVSGLRAGATRHTNPSSGRFASRVAGAGGRQARLTGTLKGV